MFNPKTLYRCLLIFEREGFAESPPPILAVGTVLPGLALLLATVSNGTTGIILLLNVLVLPGVELVAMTHLVWSRLFLELESRALAGQGVLQDICLSFNIIDPQDLPEMPPDRLTRFHGFSRWSCSRREWFRYCWTLVNIGGFAFVGLLHDCSACTWLDLQWWVDLQG